MKTERDFERYRVGDVFRSRKNRVFKIRVNDDIQVAKVYPQSNATGARAEYDFLIKCSERNLMVPAPFRFVDNTLVMRYLEGPNVADMVDGLLVEGELLNDSNGVSTELLARGLAEWLTAFHLAFDGGQCRGDTTLRNFILSKGRVYGLDFEEAHEGDPILDLGELCANILGMRPLFGKVNFGFASRILKEYWRASGDDRSEAVPEAIASGLEHYARFRQDGDLLMEWARRFRAEGIAMLEQRASEV